MVPDFMSFTDYGVGSQYRGQSQPTLAGSSLCKIIYCLYVQCGESADLSWQPPLFTEITVSDSLDAI